MKRKIKIITEEMEEILNKAIVKELTIDTENELNEFLIEHLDENGLFYILNKDKYNLDA